MHQLVIDLEATCWDSYVKNERQEIIELGAYLVDGYGMILDKYVSFVKPEINPRLSIYCRQLTNISQSEVDNAPTFGAMHRDMINWLERNDVVEIVSYISWGRKDRALIDDALDMALIDDSFLNYHVDLKAMYQIKNKLKKQVGLHKALKMEGIEHSGQSHRALDDAYNLLQIYLKHFGEW